MSKVTISTMMSNSLLVLSIGKDYQLGIGYLSVSRGSIIDLGWMPHLNLVANGAGSAIAQSPSRIGA